MSMDNPVNVELRLPLPKGAPERLKGSAAWLEPTQMVVHGHYYGAATHYSGKAIPARCWFYVTITGYTPGTRHYARGQYGAELQPGPDGSYSVPADPWLTIPVRVMDPLRHALEHLAAAVGTSEAS